MARPLRLQYPGAWYHVMNRGTNREPLFRESKDREYFYGVLANAVRLWRIRIHAYNLMGNHYHLLIDTPLGNLSRAMRHIDGVYTQWFNKKYHRDGPLLRGRYKSILIDKDSYLLELVRYIHLNKVRASLVKYPTEDTSSSHRAYMQPEGSPSWLTLEEVQALLSSDPGKVSGLLSEFIREGVSKPIGEMLDAGRWPAVLGDKTFVQRIRSRIKDKDLKNEEFPQRQEILRQISPEDVLLGVARAHKVKVEDLTKKSSARKNQARKVAMVMLRRLCRMTYSEIGKIMGGIGYGSIASACRELGDEKGMEDLLQKISKGQRN